MSIAVRFKGFKLTKGFVATRQSAIKSDTGNMYVPHKCMDGTHGTARVCTQFVSIHDVNLPRVSRHVLNQQYM